MFFFFFHFIICPRRSPSMLLSVWLVLTKFPRSQNGLIQTALTTMRDAKNHKIEKMDNFWKTICPCKLPSTLLSVPLVLTRFPRSGNGLIQSTLIITRDAKNHKIEKRNNFWKPFAHAHFHLCYSPFHWPQPNLLARKTALFKQR